MITDPRTKNLADWLAPHVKDFEIITQKRSSDGAMIDRALGHVKRFIVEKNLILYGGQAIDYALRLKGSFIYPEYQTPDFDVYSSDSVHDAYELAELLHKEGFRNVVAIRAIHLQTMRVGVDSVIIADISYTPPAVFKSIPTIMYRNMRVVHPDFQRADLHLAFCFPLNSPPREDVFHRFGKDLKRFNLFEQFYPLASGKELGAPVEGGGKPSRVTATVDLERVALHGFAAYGLLRDALNELLRIDKVKVTAPELGVDVKTSDGVTSVSFAPPPNSKKTLVVATPWPEKIIPSREGKEDEKVVRYAPYMDLKPETTVIPGENLEVFTSKDRLLAISVLKKGDARVKIVTPQYLLLYFLYEAHMASGEERDMYVYYYRATLEVLAAADKIISKMAPRDAIKPSVGYSEASIPYAKFLDSSPFGLTVRTLGDVNHNDAYLIMKARTATVLGKTFPGMPNLSAVPANYYLATAKKRPTFDYSSNPAFIRAGQKIGTD